MTPARLLGTMLLLLLPTPAGASPTADQLLARGIERYGMAQFENSLSFLLHARQRTRDGERLAQIQLYIAANELELGRSDEARAALREALRRDPRLKAPAGVKERLRQMLEEVGGQLLGELEVKGGRPGDELLVDGQRFARLPYRGPLVAGRHLLQVGRMGGRWQRRHVELRPGQTVTATFVTPGVTKPDAEQASGRTSSPESAPASSRLTWPAVAAGSALVCTALGIWLWRSADGDYDRWQTELETWHGLPISSATREPLGRHIGELEDAVRAKEAGAGVLWGVAGGLLVTSVVLLLRRGQRGADERAGDQRAALRPLLGRETGLMLSVRY